MKDQFSSVVYFFAHSSTTLQIKKTLLAEQCESSVFNIQLTIFPPKTKSTGKRTKIVIAQSKYHDFSF